MKVIDFSLYTLFHDRAETNVLFYIYDKTGDNANLIKIGKVVDTKELGRFKTYNIMKKREQQ